MPWAWQIHICHLALSAFVAKQQVEKTMHIFQKNSPHTDVDV